MYGRCRSELHDQLPDWNHHGGTGPVEHRRLVGHHDLRRHSPDDHAFLLGLRERGQRGVAPTPPTCGTAATSSSSVGNYASTCSGAVDSNYSITYTSGTVAVGAAQLVITASSSSTTYGSDPPAVTPLYKGFENGDTAASLSTPPTCSTTDASSSPVGSYPTSCSGAVDPNYTISYSNGSVQVDPAPLTITASSGMSTYGAAPLSVTPSVSGLQNSEDSTVLGDSLSCTTTASSSSPVGTYATSCSGAADANYSITYVAGTITVTPALLSITASSGSMTYAGAVPTVTPTISGLQNGDNIDVLGSGLACSSSANSSSPVGSYPTSCAGAFDANYSITYIAGAIAVHPAPLTITASSGFDDLRRHPAQHRARDLRTAER